jgi:polysaccharide export outer membrane protein
MFAPAVPKTDPALRQFGYDFFQRRTTATFTAIGDNYVLGPGDALVVYIWGDSVDIASIEPRYDVPIDRNGLCFFPPVGTFSAWGLDLQSVKEYLKSALAKKYKKIDLSLTLGALRQFPVYVSGFVNSPGIVSATAVNSLFDVIAQAGGIMKTGSLRNVVLTRKGQDKAVVFDLYDALVFGKPTDIQVREGDSILVREIGAVAGITGAIKRPGIYEFNGEKSVSDLIALAGGLLPSAYIQAVSIVRFDAEHRRIIDIGSSSTNSAKFVIENGDLVRTAPAVDLIVNKVDVEGEVEFPGEYSIEAVPTLRALLARVKVLQDANLYYARIYRTGPGGFSQNISFQPRMALDGTWDTPLMAFDRVRFFRFGDETVDPEFNNFPNTITMEGPIRYPGMYTWIQGVRLKDILGVQDFLIDTDLDSAEILRRDIGTGEVSILTFSPQNVAAGSEDAELRPLDRIRFFQKTVDAPVEVSGSVKESKIILYYDGISLIDVLRMVTLNGDPRRLKAYIYHENPSLAVSATTTGSRATPQTTPKTGTQGSTYSTATAPSQALPVETTPQKARKVVYLNDFLQQQSTSDIPLQPGDRIVFIPTVENEKNPQIIVRGQVNNPGAQIFTEGMRISDALRAAGGFTPQAFPQGIVLLRQSAAALQKEQLDHAAKILDLTLQQNVEKSAVAASGTTSSDQSLAINLQIQAQKAQLEALQSQIADVLGRISVTMPKTIDQLIGSPADLPLDDGDKIFIPNTPTFVQIIGEVFNPVTVAFREGLKVKDYLATVGGMTDNADRGATYLIRADGTVVSPKQKPSILWFTPTIEDDPVYAGDTIVVAKKESTTDTVLPVIRDVSQIIGSVAGTALSIYAILKQ